MTDNMDISDSPSPPTDWAAQLLTFWFDAHGFDDWYGGGPAFDAEVRDLAEEWHNALRSQPAETFLTDPDTALAATILFDQVPRNLFRGHADAFATDDLALAIARGIVAGRFLTTSGERLDPARVLELTGHPVESPTLPDDVAAWAQAFDVAFRAR